jgi:transposase
MSGNQIATTIKRSRNVVQNYLLLKEEYNTKKSPGRPSSLSLRDKRHIVTTASNKRVSAKQVKAELQLPQSEATIGRVLRHADTLSYDRIQRKPKLQEHHRVTRLNWAQERMSWTTQWRSIIFSDEKRWNLDGPDGRAHYWHDLRKEPLVLSKQTFGGGGVMVWAGFSWHGKTRIHFVSGTINSIKYQQILQECLLPLAQQIAGPNWVFQQDNASCHASASTRQWFEEQGMRVLPWPALSPDVNPIENLWGIVTRRVYHQGRQYHSVPDLKKAIINEWEKVTLRELRILINSMSKRIFQLINRNGSFTDY